MAITVATKDAACVPKRRTLGVTVRRFMQAILLGAPFAQYLFFAVCITFGLNYDQLSSRGTYSTVCICLCLICMLCFFKTLVVDRTPYGKRVWLFLCFAGIVSVDLVYTNTGYHQYDYLANFLVFGITGICSGLYFVNSEGPKAIGFVLDVVMVLCLVGAVLFELSQYSASIWTVRGYANLSYQSISYMAAFAFALDLWSLVFANPGSCPLLRRRPRTRVLRMALLPVCLVAVLLSGGRGGVLAVGAVCVVVLIMLAVKGRLGPRAAIALLAIAVALTVAFYMNLDTLAGFRGFERIATRGDNRSDVWDMAINAFAQAPVFGYGFGGYGTAFNGLYPHNIILDILLSAGLVGLLLFTVFCVYVLKRLRQILNQNLEWGSLLLIIGAFSVAFLSVSGTFLSYAPFWFFLSAVLAYQVLPPEGSESLKL